MHLHKMHLHGACFFTLKSFVATQMTIRTRIAQNDNEYSRCQIFKHKSRHWNVINSHKKTFKDALVWMIITRMTRKPPSEGEIFVFTKMSFTNNNIGVDIITIGSLSLNTIIVPLFSRTLTFKYLFLVNILLRCLVQYV